MSAVVRPVRRKDARLVLRYEDGKLLLPEGQTLQPGRTACESVRDSENKELSDGERDEEISSESEEGGCEVNGS